jgi:hypothetical protein
MKNKMDNLKIKFSSIKERCNPYTKHLVNRKHYGGRGIKCLWKSFEEFRDDMFQSYIKHVSEFGEKNTTIDRIDVNGNYCKENCRWITKTEQTMNKTNTLYLTFNNKTKTVIDWSKEFGIDVQKIRRRMHSNWDIKDILSKNRSNRKMAKLFIEFNGMSKSVKEWSVITGINYNRLLNRINKLKWSTEKAFKTPVRKKRL